VHEHERLLAIAAVAIADLSLRQLYLSIGLDWARLSVDGSDV